MTRISVVKFIISAVISANPLRAESAFAQLDTRTDNSSTAYSGFYERAFAEESWTPRYVGGKLEEILDHVFGSQMAEYRCVVWAGDDGTTWWPDSGTYVGRTAVMNLRVPDGCERTNSTRQYLLEAWSHHCRGIILSSNFAECFLDLWEEVRMISMYRNYPRLVVLPSDLGRYAHLIYSMPQATYLADIVSVEIISEDGTCNDGQCHVDIVTNNFYVDPRLDNSSTVLPLSSPLDSANLTDVDLFPDKLMNLHGKPLGLAILEYPPYGILEPLDGMEVRLVLYFCRLYNCTIFPVVDDFAWGDIYPNKTGDGILGNVFADKADFGNGAVYLWPSHHPYLDYSSAYSITKVTCMVPRPLLYPGWQIPLHPFAGLMWAAQVLSILAAALTLYYINKFADKYGPAAGRQTAELDSLAGLLLRSLGMSLLQPPSGGPLRPGSPLRSFFTLFEALFLLFTTLYSGALESYLTIPVHYPPIDTVEEFYSSGISWAADHEAWVYSLMGASDPNVVGLLSRFEVHSSAELEQLGNEGKYGLTLEIMAAGHVTYQKHLSADMIFEHHVMKEGLYFTSLITVLRKGGPYSEKFDSYLHRCLSGGLLNLWEGNVATAHLSSMIQTALEISQSTRFHHSPRQLGVVHVQGAFFVLTVGLVAAALSLAYENYQSRKSVRVETLTSDVP